MKKTISKILMSALVACSLSPAMSQWTTTGTVISPTTLSNNLSIGTTSGGANIFVQKSAQASIGVKSTTTGATAFLDKGSATSNGVISYRTLGVSQWSAGLYGNNNYSIRNIVNSSFPLVITQTDNVGIGTQTPTAKLDVRGTNANIIVGTGTGTGGALYLGNSNHGFQRGFPVINSNNDAGLYTTAGNLWLSTHNNTVGDFVLTSDGNVGIGTNVPANKLSVAGSANVDGSLLVRNSTTVTAYGQLTHSGSPNGNFHIDAYGTGGTYINAYSGQGVYIGDGGISSTAVAYFKTNGNVGIGTNTPNAPLQFANSTANRKVVLYDQNNNNHQYYGFGINGGTLRYQVDATGANHIFYAGTSSTTSNELMRIMGTGSVGIGTATPSQKLDVAGTIKANNNIIVDGSATNNGALTGNNCLLFGGIASGEGIASKRTAGGNIYGLDFYTASANRMTITSAGKVGIGTTTPPHALSVTGNSSVDGQLLIRNNVNPAFYGKIENSTNFHLDTYGPSGNMYLNYFDGDAVYVGNGAQGVVASFLTSGKVGIGTTTPGYKLDVCGTIRATEVRVETGWCDYVFANDYQLRPLSEVESFIKENKHLPEVTPGAEIETNGLEVGKVSAQMIKKIEELTLYAIEQQKMIEKLQLQVEVLNGSKK